MELEGIEDTFLRELDGGLPFGRIRIGNDADEEGCVVRCAECADFRSECAHEFFGGESLCFAEYESEQVGAEFSGEEAVFFASDAANFDHGRRFCETCSCISSGFCRFEAFGIAAFGKFFPELALSVFIAAFERIYDFFGESRILGDRFTDENACKSEAAGVGGIGATVNA